MIENKNILLVSPLPPPIGGIATWTLSILKSFNSETKCNLLHYNSAMKGRRITQHSFFKRIFVGIRQMVVMIPEIITIVKDKNIHVVHITSSASYGLFRDYFLLKKLNRLTIKSILHFHFGRIKELSALKNWEWKMICKVISLSTKVIVIDNISYKLLVELGFTNIEYLPNPIAKDIENSEKNIPNIFSNRVKGKIVFVGHVTRPKGVVELVNACSQINNVSELVIIGPYERSFKEELETIAKIRNKGAWLKLLGGQDKDIVLDHMRTCQIFTLPSYTEGFPNVILEAMATGCSIIATDVGAIPDMIDAYTSKLAGVCIQPQDTNALKNAIESLLDNEEFSKEIGKRAKDKLFANFTIDIIKEKIINIWISII